MDSDAQSTIGNRDNRNSGSKREPGDMTNPGVLSTTARLAAAMCLLALIGGCSRAFWRNQADRDVYNELEKKTADPRWDVPRLDIIPDPRSRFYDAYDLDHGPLPPDDPSAARYMLKVSGMDGYKSWHKFGRTFSIENPRWLESFGLTTRMIEQASVNGEPSGMPDMPTISNLTLPEAIELSYIHNRDYQTQIEDVYLSALALTFEQFRFAVRYLNAQGVEPSADLEHSSTPHGPNNLALDSAFGVSQLLPSGAQLAVELANNTLWMFSGPNQMNTASVLSYSIVQPLLFQAGRKIVLENLTQAERNVLYSVRDLARFRRVFFTQVVAGPGGFLDLLQQAQLVKNQADNIRRTREQMLRLEATKSQVSLTYFEKMPKPAEALLNEIDPSDPLKSKFPTLVAQLSYNAAAGRLQWRGLMTPAQQQTLLTMSDDAAFQRAARGLIEQQNEKKVYESLSALPSDFSIPRELQDLLQYDAVRKRLYWQWRANTAAGEIKLMTDDQAQLLLGISTDPAFQSAASALVARLTVDVRDLDFLQLENRLRQAENQYRQFQLAYRNLRDQFKIVLGLPPNINLEINTDMLDRFQLIDERLFGIEERLNRFVAVSSSLDEINPDEGRLRDAIRQLRTLHDAVKTDALDVARADLRSVKRILPQRLRELETAEERGGVVRDVARDEELLNRLQQQYDDVTRVLRLLEQDFDVPDARLRNRQSLVNGGLGVVAGRQVWIARKQAARRAVAELRERLLLLTQSAQRPQAGLRSELILLPEFSFSIEDVVRLALQNRLDLKNSRAAVMDARRKLEIAANRLQAVLNLRVEGNIGTKPGTKPLDFRGTQSTFRMGIGFTAPLDLVNARNAYRSAQITYERARRAYMQLEDGIKRAVRREWRDIYLARKNFENTRRQISSSAAQYQFNAMMVVAPAAQQRGNTGLNLLNALNSVLQAQNSLIGFWVDYETNRLNIYRDMGIMEVDSSGMWTDPYYRQAFRTQTANPAPPAPAPALPTPAQRRSSHEIRTIAESEPGRTGRRSHPGRIRLGDERTPPAGGNGPGIGWSGNGPEVDSGAAAGGGGRRGHIRLSVGSREGLRSVHRAPGTGDAAR